MEKLDQLLAERNNLIIQRASLKDQIEMIERRLPVVGYAIQVLQELEAQPSDD